MLEDGTPSELLAYTYKVNYSIKFITTPTLWSVQAAKLHVQDLLEDVDSPLVLVHDLIVLYCNSGTEVVSCREICQEEDIS